MVAHLDAEEIMEKYDQLAPEQKKGFRGKLNMPTVLGWKLSAEQALKDDDKLRAIKNSFYRASSSTNSTTDYSLAASPISHSSSGINTPTYSSRLDASNTAMLPNSEHMPYGGDRNNNNQFISFSLSHSPVSSLGSLENNSLCESTSQSDMTDAEYSSDISKSSVETSSYHRKDELNNIPRMRDATKKILRSLDIITIKDVANMSVKGVLQRFEDMANEKSWNKERLSANAVRNWKAAAQGLCDVKDEFSLIPRMRETSKKILKMLGCNSINALATLDIKDAIHRYEQLPEEMKSGTLYVTVVNNWKNLAITALKRARKNQQLYP